MTHPDPFEAYFNYQGTCSLAGKTALVTGASSGIGLATACALAEAGVNLKLVARRLDRLQALQSSLKMRFPLLKVDFLSGDIGLLETRAQLENKGFYQVDILINNAGLAIGKEPVSSSDFNDWQTMIQVNLTAAIDIMRRVLPYQQKQGEGDMICLSSIAAHIPYEGGAVYCATKHALRAFCTALRQETHGQNLRIIQISPGMVKTEFSQVRLGSNEKAESVYIGMTPIKPQDIAQQILAALRNPRHLTLDDVLMMATDQAGPTQVRRHNI